MEKKSTSLVEEKKSKGRRAKRPATRNRRKRCKWSTSEKPESRSANGRDLERNSQNYLRESPGKKKKRQDFETSTIKEKKGETPMGEGKRRGEKVERVFKKKNMCQVERPE